MQPMPQQRGRSWPGNGAPGTKHAQAPPGSGLRIGEWRHLLHDLLAPEEIVASAAQGTSGPGFDPGWPSTPDLLVLRALAFEDELRHGLRAAGLARASRILDAGCGPGMITRLLAETAAANVLGLDREPRLLRFADGIPSPRRGRAVFVEGDVLAGLPLGDDGFDAVFAGDMWLPGMLGELRRVTRPGGCIVVKFSAVLPRLTYVWDRAFDLRMQAALVEASRRQFGDADHTDGLYSRRGEFHDAGPWESLHRFSVLIERFAPVAEAFEEVERQIFGRYCGPLLREVVDEDDWARLAGLWDPRADSYVFRQPDGHFTESLHFAVAQLPR